MSDSSSGSEFSFLGRTRKKAAAAPSNGDDSDSSSIGYMLGSSKRKPQAKRKAAAREEAAARSLEERILDPDFIEGLKLRTLKRQRSKELERERKTRELSQTRPSDDDSADNCSDGSAIGDGEREEERSAPPEQETLFTKWPRVFPGVRAENLDPNWLATLWNDNRKCKGGEASAICDRLFDIVCHHRDSRVVVRAFSNLEGLATDRRLIITGNSCPYNAPFASLKRPRSGSGAIARGPWMLSYPRALGVLSDFGIDIKSALAGCSFAGDSKKIADNANRPSPSGDVSDQSFPWFNFSKYLDIMSLFVRTRPGRYTQAEKQSLIRVLGMAICSPLIRRDPNNCCLPHLESCIAWLALALGPKSAVCPAPSPKKKTSGARAGKKPAVDIDGWVAAVATVVKTFSTPAEKVKIIESLPASSGTSLRMRRLVSLHLLRDELLCNELKEIDVPKSSLRGYSQPISDTNTLITRAVKQWKPKLFDGSVEFYARIVALLRLADVICGSYVQIRAEKREFVHLHKQWRSLQASMQFQGGVATQLVAILQTFTCKYGNISCICEGDL